MISGDDCMDFVAKRSKIGFKFLRDVAYKVEKYMDSLPKEPEVQIAVVDGRLVMTPASCALLAAIGEAIYELVLYKFGKYCPDCGSPNPPLNEVCESCGRRLD